MWTTTESPVGILRIVVQDGAVVGVDFLGEPSDSGPESRSVAVAAARTALRPLGERHDDDPLLREAVGQLRSYFDRRLHVFDLPLAPQWTPFQLRVWEQLRSIPYGHVASYGEIAGRLGMTGHGARAVGLANGRNPVPIVIPCHRVVGADGSLTGYGGGMARKQALLALEQEGLF